ncbi:MAG: ABC-F family ATP-binding cassette domain-containing protein [Treponema sp.]|jgi:ATP-binding cassette subfamily F protein 3|nr:ABC-F family ATP-binding cassette domain-containing protein [Treponema sp.]
MQVQCGGVSLAIGDRDILDRVSIRLRAGDGKSGSRTASRAALAGANGSGKSTLLQIIAGLRAPDSGTVAVSAGCRISYLPQSGLAFAGRSLREEADTAYRDIAGLLDKMEALGRRLEQPGTGADDRTVKALVEEHHRLSQEVEDSGYWRREEQIEQVLGGLGFSRPDLDRPCGEFSGGWQMRIALAKVLLENPGIMLLDEPTNYLDIEARTWLEDWLGRFAGGCLVVSHDRWFLDACVNEVYEIFRGSLKRYAGNYSAYEQTRREELEILLKRHAEQQEEIAKSEALIQRFRYKASKAAMVQERIKKLEKMERIEIPEGLKKIAIAFPPAPRSGRTVLTLSGVSKSYGGRQVLAGLDLSLDAGERLVAAGRNGAGKSTLLRIIAGADHNYGGTVAYGSGVSVGYFSQDSAERLTDPAFFGGQNPDSGPGGGSPGGSGKGGGQTALAFVEEAAPTALVPKARDMLGAFLFRGDDVYKPLRVLSGGEKSRLALLRLLLNPVNLLVLDEPTNHLDIHSKDVLLDALLRFSGTVIFVSHDRAFMEALSTKTLELRVPDPPGGTAAVSQAGAAGSGASAARLFYGGYGYYLERLEREAREAREAWEAWEAWEGPPETAPPRTALSTAKAAVPLKSAPPVKSPAKSSAKPASPVKQRQTLIRRLERQEAEILAALDVLEAEKTALETELVRPEVYSNGEKVRAARADLDRLAGELEAKTALWEQTAAELEAARREPVSPGS